MIVEWMSARFSSIDKMSDASRPTNPRKAERSLKTVIQDDHNNKKESIFHVKFSVYYLASNCLKSPHMSTLLLLVLYARSFKKLVV